MDVDEDSVMEGLDGNGTESQSVEEPIEPNSESSMLLPTNMAPTALKDAAPTPTPAGSDPALSPSPPPIGSLALPGARSDDEDMDGDSPMTEPSDLDDEDVEEIPRSPKTVEIAITKSADPSLPYASKRTGLVYDSRMRFHAELNTDEDDIHPEDPRRIWEIYKELVSGGLVDEEESPLDYSKNPFKLWRIPIRMAEPAEIALIHTTELYDWVAALSNWSDEELIDYGRKLDSVYLHKTTMYCASLSCGGAIEACSAVVNGSVKNAIAVIRPPGHHAEHGKPGGFCFFNNVCVAARVCQNNFGNLCRKILILDWDVHHGNGVQQAFEDDPNVLYISLHVHKNGQFYPPGNYGDHLHCGLKEGVGKNINIPWPTHGMGDGDYLYAFQQVVMPVAQEFDPDLVIISAGFDAAEGDLLGACHISPAGYAHMTHMLMSLAGGKVAVCLEGGYNLRAIATSAFAVTRTLMGEAPDRMVNQMPSKIGIETVQLVKRTQSQYWKCLYPKDLYQRRLAPPMGGERLHDVLRNRQASEWSESFGMVPLWVNCDRISKSFENQVLATPNYIGKRPLLVIFHDPPETFGVSDPVSGKLEPHNVVVVSAFGGEAAPLKLTLDIKTDVAKTYVEWAVSNDFAVIDVNIPSHITPEVDTDGYVEADPVELRAASTRELAVYLWDNYIEISDASHIYLMGVGSACAGIVWLLSNEDRCQDRVDGVINFIGNTSILGVSRPADDGAIAAWYYQHSTIFVADEHYVWNQDQDRPKKIRKRYGKLVQSSYSNIQEMLRHHKAEVLVKLQSAIEDWREDVAREEEEKLRMESLRRQAMADVVPVVKQAPMVLDGGPLSPVRGQMSPVPMKSPALKQPPMGMFTVTSSPGRPRSSGSPGRPPSRSSPSRRSPRR